MARAETVTKLSLDRYAQIMGINPLHFNGVSIPAIGATACESIWYQHPWQHSDAVSREDVARCIAEAEAAIENVLGYRLLPTWEEDEWHEPTRHYRVEAFKYGGNIRGTGDVVQTRWQQFISGGIRSSDLVEAGVDILWTDEDGDGYFETGSVVVASEVLNGCEMHVYYPGKSGDPEWEIRPVVVIDGPGIVSIQFRRELCVLEEIHEQLGNRDLEGADGLADADFLSTVDVYRVYNDPQRQVQMLWEPGALSCGICGSCSACSYSTIYGCLHTRGKRELGLVAYTPATWSAEDLAFTTALCVQSRQPDAVRLWYYAGLRSKGDCDTILMDGRWARAVAYYATALLDRTTCSCNAARFEHWQEDLAFLTGSSELASYNLSPAHLDNPFGTRRGMVAAWKMIMPADLATQVAVLL